MNKRNNTIKGVFLTFAVLLMFSSCAETPGPDEGVADARTIRFASAALTRAAIDDANGLNTPGESFSVWGNYTDNTSGSGTVTGVFDAEKVTYSEGTGWGYENTEYWYPGKTYCFYALYPSVDGLGEGTEATCDYEGSFSVTGFDATHGIDLMVARAEPREINSVQDPAAPVAFAFAHRLARLSFAVKAVGCEATVTAFKVNGVTWKADLSCPASGNPSWSDPQKTADGDSRLTKAGGEITVADGTTVSMLGDVLLPPHTADELAADAVISMAYRLKGDTEDRMAAVKLATGTITQWDAGQQYSYTLTVSASSITLTWKVKAWDEQDTEVSWGPDETGGTN